LNSMKWMLWNDGVKNGGFGNDQSPNRSLSARLGTPRSKQ
jgi:hypothetical protein